MEYIAAFQTLDVVAAFVSFSVFLFFFIEVEKMPVHLARNALFLSLSVS